MPRPTHNPCASRPAHRASRTGRLLPLLLAGSLAACGSSESSEPEAPEQTPAAAESVTATKTAGLLTTAPDGAAPEVVVPTLYVGGRLQTAGRPARGAELVYAVTWDGMDQTKLKWTDMRTGDEGEFVIELPGSLRQFNRELQLVLRPRKPASSPFKFLRTDLPYPLPQGPVNLGPLTIERREMPGDDAQASDG
ncbi:MAG: hypothetical protein ACYS26_06445 [Planctomycetota bacterium]|jgi:hypothetical protein